MTLSTCWGTCVCVGVGGRVCVWQRASPLDVATERRLCCTVVWDVCWARGAPKRTMQPPTNPLGLPSARKEERPYPSFHTLLICPILFFHPPSVHPLSQEGFSLTVLCAPLLFFWASCFTHYSPSDCLDVSPSTAFLPLSPV